MLNATPASGSDAVSVVGGNKIEILLSENVDPCTINDGSVLFYMFETGRLRTGELRDFAELRQRVRLLRGRRHDGPDAAPIGRALVALAAFDLPTAIGVGGRDGAAPRKRKPRPGPSRSLIFRLEGAVETAPDGSFSFDSMAAGVYSLSVQSDQHPVYRADEVEIAKKEESQHDIVMEQGIALRGRVRSSRTQDPISGASLSFRLSDRERRSVKTDDEGKYEIKGLFPRDIGEVHISAASYSIGMFEDLEVIEKPSHRRSISNSTPAARVEGKVVDRDGEPVFNARVSMTPLLDGDFSDRQGARRVFRQTMTQNKRTTTDVDGVFKFDDLSGGLSFQVAVEHAEFKRHQSVEITIDPGEEVKEVELVLERGARIEVLVLDPDGVALPGARVRAERQRTEEERDERRAREREQKSRESEDEDSRRLRESRRRYEEFVRTGGRSSAAAGAIRGRTARRFFPVLMLDST